MVAVQHVRGRMVRHAVFLEFDRTREQQSRVEAFMRAVTTGEAAAEFAVLAPPARAALALVPSPGRLTNT